MELKKHQVKYVIMADADNSYDFLASDIFIKNYWKVMI